MTGGRTVRPEVAAASVNRRAYNAIAAEWDAARSRFVPGERAYVEALLEDFAPGALILDLGCGTGRPMAEHVLSSGHRVVGWDQAEELLRSAARRLPGGVWVHGRIEDCAWAGAYDGVICWDALFHVDRAHHPAVLARIAASLKPGGRVMLTVGGSAQPPFADTMFDHVFRYDSLPPADVVRLLERLGLRPFIREFMNLPTGGRERGRYAIVAEKRP